MPKRKLNIRQKRRIKSAQSSFDLDQEGNLGGQVISHHGTELDVEPSNSTDPSLITCKFRSNLGSIVCGDRIIYQQQENEATVVAIQPRQNLLQRLDGFGQFKAVAANVSQLIICLAIRPEPNLFLLDQYLLSAEQLGLNALIVLNKIDLLEQEDDDPFQIKHIYQTIGYPVIQTSIKQNINLDQLQQACSGEINVISGVSGVGKSSLTKAIMPNLEIAIGEISEANQEGRHTTRTSRLYHLPQGGDLIDTPGIRGFNPVVDSNQTIAQGFREINELAQQCKFANCSHLNEPKCAVLDAVKSGEIDNRRYQSYCKLTQEQG